MSLHIWVSCAAGILSTYNMCIYTLTSPDAAFSAYSNGHDTSDMQNDASRCFLPVLGICWPPGHRH